jgi:hypothetical protein
MGRVNSATITLLTLLPIQAWQWLFARAQILGASCVNGTGSNGF